MTLVAKAQLETVKDTIQKQIAEKAVGSVGQKKEELKVQAKTKKVAKKKLYEDTVVDEYVTICNSLWHNPTNLLPPLQV